MVSASTPVRRYSWINRVLLAIQRHWLLTLNVMMGVYVLTPLSAPILMELNLDNAGRVIYLVYSTQCHQLPERSYFLFGQNTTYSLDTINAARGSADILTLRNFIGNPQMGYKIAWSDRMISLYTSVWIGSMMVAWFGRRKRLRPLPVIVTAILLVPIALDGGTHFISDLQGFAQGFRDTNAWLRALTVNMLPSSFYAGDAWGSFNSIMRLWTGVVAGSALALAVIPRLDQVFADMNAVPIR